MTQSGQGEGPSARPAREGIVLPSDGGAPLLPGQTGEGSAFTVPGGGQSGQDGQGGHASVNGPDGRAAPAGGQAWGQPWGPGQSAQTPPPAQNWGQSSDPRAAWGGAPAPQQPLPPEGAQPLPPTTPPGDEGATQYLPPVASSAGEGPTQYIPPVAPAADEGATQYIPPVAPAADEGATQYIPPVAPAADEGATQYIPPAGSGALPPEAPMDDATRFLGRSGAGPLPSAVDPDAQATQYLPPVSGQPGPAAYAVRPGTPGQAPPAEFDSLFRDGAAGAQATQHLPRFGDGPGVPSGAAPGRRGDDDGGGRTRSRVPLIAAVGVGIVVLGIGAGAMLSGGGGTDGKSDNSKSVAATGSAPDASAASTDPARAQAVALDKLLADSGNSRGTVIRAVAEVKACQNLDQAATQLRDAAKQRNDLVTRLSGLAVDKLPDHDALTAALTSAWKASASADTHYAAWADQVSGKKGCKKGQARVTGQTAAGNRDSGTASAQKVTASRLWNVIAQKYGLTQRQPTQL